MSRDHDWATNEACGHFTVLLNDSHDAAVASIWSSSLLTTWKQSVWKKSDNYSNVAAELAQKCYGKSANCQNDTKQVDNRMLGKITCMEASAYCYV